MAAPLRGLRQGEEEREEIMEDPIFVYTISDIGGLIFIGLMVVVTIIFFGAEKVKKLLKK